jgi:hypothetical protein
MIKYNIQIAKVNKMDDRVPKVKKYEHMQVLNNNYNENDIPNSIG